MPTGYTAAIGEGITFEQFVWRCARGMGALVLMRDDPMDAPIPERFEPSDYDAKAIDTAQKRLTQLKAMSPVEVAGEAAKHYREQLEAFEKRKAENEALRARYAAMLAKVMAWRTPTTEHDGLKAFMVEQIEESMKFDCINWTEPKQLTPEEWLAAQTTAASRDLAYHAEENQKEIERTELRNRWIAALRESVPCPEPSPTRRGGRKPQ